uniref:Putative secreted peptide n=1 Tax=Anopheles braziliensis TaxID=58242 RepID=A0A2M3ZV58_9DIPT
MMVTTMTVVLVVSGVVGGSTLCDAIPCVQLIVNSFNRAQGTPNIRLLKRKLFQNTTFNATQRYGRHREPNDSITIAALTF